MMSNEEWERKMDFLLNQQARFDAEMYELKAAQARTKESLELAAENISHLGAFIHEGFGLTLNLFRETNANLKETNTNLKETDAIVKETAAEIKELKESQKLTDEALRKLITRFDRHLSDDHPGLEN